MSEDPVARMDRGLRLTALLWIVGVIATVGAVALLVTGQVEGRNKIHLEQLVFAAWTLGPPCWFVLQHWLWPPVPNEYSRFRAQQFLVTAVWAGVAAFLAAIFFGRWS